MFYPVFCKFRFVILWFIQSNNKTNIHLFKNGNIIFWSEWAISISHIKRSRECHELAWKNPVKISVLDLFKMLVLLNIKSCVIIPAQSYSILETLEAVKIDTLIRTRSHGRVSIWQELILVRLESRPSFIGALLEHYDHKCTHKERRVCLFGVI